MSDPLDILGGAVAPPPKHMKLGASNAKRWKNCPGSIPLSADLPRSPGNKYSAEGTVAHTLAELAVKGAPYEALLKKIGDTVMEDGFEVEITEEMVEAAVEYRDHVVSIVKTLQETPKKMPIVGKAEERLHAHSIDEDAGGTTDYLLYRKGDELHVFDFKYGKKIVEAKENDQMGVYAVGAMDGAAGKAFSKVMFHIVQPRAGGTRSWEAPKAWLKKFHAETKAAAALTKTKDAPRKAGSWCTWCPGENVCPEANGAVQAQAQVDFTAIAPPVVKGQELPSVIHLSVEQMCQALEWEDMVNSYFESLRLRLRAMLDAGLHVPGYKLVDGKSNRKWVDEAKVVAEFAPVLGEDALFIKKLISPAALEKIVGKKGGKLDHLTFKPEGKKSIARATDPRPAAKNSAQEDFTAIETTVDALVAEKVPDLLDSLDLNAQLPKSSVDGAVDQGEDPLGLDDAPKKKEPLWPV